MYQYNRNTGEITDCGDGQHIATTSDSATHEQGQLIAAAPELLEALKSAKRVLESGNLESQDSEETAIEILEAIAKAEGKESHV